MMDTCLGVTVSLRIFVFPACVDAHACLSSIVRSGKHLINCKVKLTGTITFIKRPHKQAEGVISSHVTSLHG